jgi:hypothetical protein
MIKRQYVDEASKIRRWARKANPNISYGFRYPDGTTHSLQEMAKDDIDFDDMLRVLRGGKVTDLRLENGEWRHNVEGKDFDGRELVFVVVLCEESEEIEVVTAWAVKPKI